MQTIIIIAIALFILVIIFARRVLIQENELFDTRKASCFKDERISQLLGEVDKLKEVIEVQEGIIEKQEK